MTLIKAKLEERFPNKDWSHCEEDTPFSRSNGVWSIDSTKWYDDLPTWTSAEIQAFLEG